MLKKELKISGVIDGGAGDWEIIIARRHYLY